MKNEIIAFIAGGAIGGVVSYYICKKNFDEQIKKEFEKERKAEEEKEKKKEEDWEKIKKETAKKAREKKSKKQYKGEKGSIDEYLKTVRDNSYIPPNAPIRPSEDSIIDIEIVSPDKIGEDEDYDIISFTYYVKADLVIDEIGESLNAKEIRDTLGEDWVHHFGEYDEDSVVIKNNTQTTYYEVLLNNDDFDYGSQKGGE